MKYKVSLIRDHVNKRSILKVTKGNDNIYTSALCSNEYYMEDTVETFMFMLREDLLDKLKVWEENPLSSVNPKEISKDKHGEALAVSIEELNKEFK